VNIKSGRESISRGGSRRHKRGGERGALPDVKATRKRNAEDALAIDVMGKRGPKNVLTKGGERQGSGNEGKTLERETDCLLREVNGKENKRGTQSTPNASELEGGGPNSRDKKKTQKAFPNCQTTSFRSRKRGKFAGGEGKKTKNIKTPGLERSERSEKKNVIEKITTQQNSENRENPVLGGG